MFRRLLIAAWMCCASCAFAQTTPVTPLPRAQTSLPYRVQLGAVVNGVYPFTFTFESLPTWLQHSSDGQVWGTPVTADETTQPVVFAATITDAQSRKMGRFMFSIAVSKDAVVPLVIAGTQATPAAAQPAAGTAPASAASPASPPPPPNTGTTPAASSAKPASMTIQPPTLHEPIEQGAKAVLGTARPLATVVLVRGKETPEVFQTIADQSGEFRIDLSTGDQKLKAAEDLQVRQIVDGVMSGSRHRTVTPYYRNGEELRAIVGYQQAGASAAKSEQNFFLDFYISRPLAFLHDPGDLNPTRLRWWGNVRVASYPQQGDVPVATFASSLITQFGQLKVNQLAQSAEYLSGLEINLLSGKFGFLGKSEETRQQFTLSLFGGGGATGPTETSSTLRVFEAPAAGT
ncbi:MAG TPA: hypothetical protein VNW97_00175, partial [Candidatus Saccharimonadales bacterium]|nr:hypothetical protein [Candidatus Saccharimonadales bacterium]